MNALKMCLNWKAVTAVTVVAVGLFVLAPDLAAAALPFLVLAICPLSMILMMVMMNGSKDESDAACSPGSTNTDSSRPSETPEEQLASLRAQQKNLAPKIDALQSQASRTPGAHRSEASIAARP